MSWKRVGKLLLKLIISLGILGYLVSQISLTSFWKALLDARHIYIILAFLLYIIGQILSAYKWRLLAKTLGFRRKFKRFLSYYFIGMFFNLFFLGSIGGDVGKAYLLAGRRDSRMRAGYSILAERFTGGMALATIGVIALITSSSIDVIPLWLKLINWMGLDVKIAPPSIDVITWWLNIGLITACVAVWALVITIPFCFQIINIMVFALIGMSLNLDVPLGYYFVIVPLVDLVSILPISISGIGVREGSYVGLLYLAGVETSQGLAFGLLGFLVVMAASLLGGIIYVSGTYPIKLRRHA
jgi:uncharacterized membrane protein YbhN (UPF0104 family)